MYSIVQYNIVLKKYIHLRHNKAEYSRLAIEWKTSRLEYATSITDIDFESLPLPLCGAACG